MIQRTAARFSTRRSASLRPTTDASKCFRLGAAVQGRLTETLWNALERPIRSLRNNGAPRYEVVWALKDVSFEISEGEVVGFIGRNGAGKSTLLKILSRITDPTEGSFDVRGRVGSLIEVGSGTDELIS